MVVEIPTGSSNPQNERLAIKSILDNVHYKEGDKWYLIPVKWWEAWRAYVGYEDENRSEIGNGEPLRYAQKPGPVDNSELLDEDGKLKRGLMEQEHYVLLPQRAWNYIINRYSGGPEISRDMISVGITQQKQVEVYPLTFKVIKQSSSSQTEQFDVEISKTSTVKKLLNKIASVMYVPPHKTRLWVESDDGTGFRQLNPSDDSIEDSRLCDGSKIIAESKMTEDWPEVPPVITMDISPSEPSPVGVQSSSPPSSSQHIPTNDVSSPSRSSSSSNSSFLSYHTSTTPSSSMGNGSYDLRSSYHPAQRGVCGLNNLGNTCFMNSALQCLTHTEPLTEYFLENRHQDEINRTNPLGMGGKIAEAYADLVKRMWDGRAGCLSPSEFKWVLSRFAPQFSGFRQHDSQELLAFLLDGLHEDLNRVTNKPYIEVKEADGRPEEVVASETWDNYLKRNQSIIVDAFMGQLKSTLVCPECNKVSVTFDPFNVISLPLPVKQERTIEIVLWRNDGNRPVKYGVNLDKRAKIADLKEALGELCGIPADELILIDVYMHKFFAVLDPIRSVATIRDTDVTFAYHVPSKPNYITIQVVQRKLEKSVFSKTRLPCGFPFLVSFPSRGTSYGDLYKLIWSQVKRMAKKRRNEGDSDDVDTMDTDTDADTDTDTDTDTDSGSDSDDISTFPFTLKSTNKSLSQCDLCPPYKYCSGCTLHPKPDPISLQEQSVIVVDWISSTDGSMNFELDEKEQIAVEYHPSALKTTPEGEDVIDIKGCLELFLTKEKLSPDDAWYCPRCKEHRQATKKMDLWKLPPVLVVHLKRFQYSRFNRDKLDTFIDFPITNLDFSPYVLGPQSVPPIYDLFAISNHMGGMGGGHYTAYALNHIDGKWYSFNDSLLHEVSSNTIKSASAYVLFYRKRDQPIITQVPSINSSQNANGTGISTTTTTTTTTTTSTYSDSFATSD
jgi:ubiquitin carboxyl-terminal hydrolase 4/11/15